MGSSISKPEKEKLFEMLDSLCKEFIEKHCDFDKQYFEHADVVNTAFLTFLHNNHAKKEYYKAIKHGWDTKYPNVTRHIKVTTFPLTEEIMSKKDLVYVGMRIREFPINREKTQEEVF